MTAANALLRAIHARLSGDAGLMALLASDGIRDRAVPQPAMPCIVIGAMETRDYSTAGEAAEEHLLSLEIWSDEDGRRQALEIAGRVHALLHDAALALEAGRLVSLLHRSTRSRREAKAKSHVATMVFRAVTE